MRFNSLCLSCLIGWSLALSSGCATTKKSTTAAKKTKSKSALVATKQAPKPSNKATAKAEPKDEADFEEYMNEENDFSIGSEDDFASDLYLEGISLRSSDDQGEVR